MNESQESIGKLNFPGTKTTERREQTVVQDGFAILFESAPIGYLVLNHRGIILKVNNTLCRYLGYTSSELERVPFVGFIFRDDQRRFLDIFPEMHRNPSGKKIRLKLLKRDEGILYTEVLGNLSSEFMETEEKGVLLLGVIDITYQHEMEMQNEAAEKKFQTLFNQSAVGISLAEVGGNFIKINKRFGEIIGYQPEELEGRNFPEMTYTADLELDEKFSSEMLSGMCDTFEFEKRYLHKDGHPVWIRLYSNIVRDILGKPIYGLASIIDISEKKRYLEELHKANDNLEEQNAVLREEFRIQDNILMKLEEAERIGSFGTFEFNIASNKGWWSKNQYLLRGFKEGEVKPDYELHLKSVHPEDREQVKKIFRGIIDSKVQEGSFDYRIVSNIDATRFIHSEYTVERDEKGKAILITGIDQDITERYLMQQELMTYRQHLEELVKDRTGKLEEQKAELENFNRLFIGREFRIKELRDEVKKLQMKLTERI